MLTTPICDDDEVLVPTGFVTDLTSSPAFVQFFIPSDGMYSVYSIIHDFDCELAEQFMKYKWRVAADKDYFRRLWNAGFYVRAPIMFLGVRLKGIYNNIIGVY